MWSRIAQINLRVRPSLKAKLEKHELLIVDSVLREGSKLSAEGVVDRVRKRVKRGVVVACLLVDARWVG
jgi:hypothetical protein